MNDLAGYFADFADWACSLAAGGEVLTANLAGERADFVRLNGAAIRQAGSVSQLDLGLELIDGRRHAMASVQLAGDRSIDRSRVTTIVADLRNQLRVVPEDPFLLYATEPHSTERELPADLPDAASALEEIRSAAAGEDLAGIYAAGDTAVGFASSTGQRNWFQAGTFNVDWSFYLRADKAAKNGYAGFQWDPAAFAAKVEWSRRQLEVLARDPIDLAPGHYRTFLAPAALRELTDMLAWGGFGLKSHRTKQTPLLRMVTDGATLHPQVTIVEDIAGGTAPNFSEDGFPRPDEVVLVDRGRYRDCLVSPRSAKEYGVTTNGASAWETPTSLRLAAGEVPAGEVVERLGTGLYVGNLWYLNFSDRAACRTTGMTRFATFWVEGGEIVAPVNALRFDDTAYHLLGDRLVGLTDEAELLFDPGTYHRRSTDSVRLPGALVEEMAFTL